MKIEIFPKISVAPFFRAGQDKILGKLMKIFEVAKLFKLSLHSV